MKTLYIDNTILPKDKKSTFLSSDAAVGATTLTVQSIIGFAINQPLLVGEIGNELSEIIFTSTVTAPTGTTITLVAGGLVNSHPQDTKVYVLDWDQVEISQAATTGGAKTVITTIANQADQKETIYNDTTLTSGYYFTRFKNSNSAAFSDYSDPVPFAGYDDDTVFMIKKRALDAINETIDQELITHEFLNQALWEGRREYHLSPGKRPFRKIFNFSVGSVTAGQYKVLVPSDLERPYTAENIFGVRIGIQPNMSYYDKKQWDTDYQGVAHSVITNSAGYTVGDKDLYVTNTRDFSSSGSVNLENDTVAYSAVGVSATAGTLRISTQGVSNHAQGIDIWQGITFGLPGNFTAYSDVAPPEFFFTGSYYVYFSTPISNTYVKQDIWMDYYSKIIGMDSDADVLDEPDFDMFVPYLTWRIKQRKNKGLDPLTDPHYQLWQQRKSMALQNEYLGTEIRITPNISHLPIPGTGEGWY